VNAICLKAIPAAEPYEAYVLPVSGYPMEAAESTAANAFLDSLCGAAQRWQLSSEVLMQLEQLDADGCREAFTEYARTWIPQTGLGVWVDRRPPEKWTQAELADVVPGDKLRPIMFLVFRVSTAQKTRVDARHNMLRFGPVLEILTPQGEAYLQGCSEVFKQGIVDPSFTCFPYYVGLIEGKSMANAKREQLDRWFQGVTLYVRQSFEDKGILIASSVALSGLFEEIGGVRDQNGWTFQP